MTVEVLSQPLTLPSVAERAMAGKPDARYESRPHGKEEWKKRARLIADQAKDWLEILSPALSASEAAADRLARSAGGKGVVLTTGQQPGLFGGPVYTLSKALSALALANEIELLTGVPVAPVFWAATDDADFREASRIAVALPGGARELVIDHAATLGPPMSAMPLGDVRGALEELVAASGSGPYPEPLALLERFYRADATIGGAYVAFLRSLLEPLGIAVLDASHPAVRAASLRTLTDALDRGDAIAKAVAANNAVIEAEGHALQVHDVPGLSLVFENRSDGRKRIPLKRAARKSESYSELGPNVLLRPIVERQILPTIAYVGGPAEVAYFAQIGPIAETLSVARPLIVPRWSCTIIEPHIRRLVDQLGLPMGEFQDAHAADARIAREKLPSDVLDEVTKLRNDIDHRADKLGSVLKEVSYIPGGSLSEGLRRNLGHRVDRLERRLVAASKRHHSELMRDVGTVRGSLFPLGKAQERGLSFVPFLVRHGKILREAMIERATQYAKTLL
jgi:bacillithiol biosynthesis cysteine-adding enzyme BshC